MTALLQFIAGGLAAAYLIGLIAAAPELLAALEGLLAVSVDTSPAELLAMIAAREAIAKAKGEQQ